MNDQNYVIEYEYLDAPAQQQRIVKKQVWDGEKFIPVVMCRQQGSLSDEQKIWLKKQFGAPGSRWDYSTPGNFYTMDDQVYTWFQLKWGNK